MSASPIEHFRALECLQESERSLLAEDHFFFVFLNEEIHSPCVDLDAVKCKTLKNPFPLLRAPYGEAAHDSHRAFCTAVQRCVTPSCELSLNEAEEPVVVYFKFSKIVSNFTQLNFRCL